MTAGAVAPKPEQRRSHGLHRTPQQTALCGTRILVLLVQLAHNLLIGLRNDLACRSYFTHYDQRLVRDVLLPGWVWLDATEHVVSITLQASHPLAARSRLFSSIALGEMKCSLIWAKLGPRSRCTGLIPCPLQSQALHNFFVQPGEDVIGFLPALLPNDIVGSPRNSLKSVTDDDRYLAQLDLLSDAGMIWSAEPAISSGR
jgi:hypothetical protein